MNIECCNNQTQWDAFVTKHAAARNHHRWLWKEVIEDTFGHPGHYLAAVENDVVRGVLPVFDVRTRLFGRSLVSIPFFTYGGILTDYPEARDQLMSAAAELALQTGANHIELRHVSKCGDWAHASSKVTMEIELPATTDEYLQRLNSAMRKKVRYACRQPLDVEWGGLELVHEFYSIFASNMRDLGTPVYPLSFFLNQIRRDPAGMRVLVLRESGRAVFSGFVSSYRDEVELPWAASVASAREKYSQLTLYWRLIEWAILNGYKRLDLGRSTPGSGPHRFKHHWNCTERPLHWQYWPADFASSVEVKRDKGRFQLAISAWKRLPVAVANAIGPSIVRGLP